MICKNCSEPIEEAEAKGVFFHKKDNQRRCPYTGKFAEKEESRESAMIQGYREMALSLHTFHSSVGPVNRMDEWKRCRYQNCRERFAIAYPEREKIEL